MNSFEAFIKLPLPKNVGGRQRRKSVVNIVGRSVTVSFPEAYIVIRASPLISCFLLSQKEGAKLFDASRHKRNSKL
jgi:hypothetical protein